MNCAMTIFPNTRMEKQILFFDLLETLAKHAADNAYGHKCGVVDFLDDSQNLT